MPERRLQDIRVQPGVNLDDTESVSVHYTDAHWIRFVNGLPRTITPYRILGWDGMEEKTTLSDAPITSIFGQFISSRFNYLYGAASGLYAAYNISSEFTNITPLKTSSVAAADSIDTQYISLASDPVTVSNGSDTVSIAINATGNFIQVGDTVTISGLTGTIGGIAASSINGSQVVRSVSGTALTITLSSSGTSDATGGGASGIVATRFVVINDTAHGLRDGERVKIESATDTGGVLAASINKEHVLRLADADSFLVNVNSVATSAVTGGGGASTVYYPQIDDGAVDASTGVGYGFGDYGVDDYGGSPVSSSLYVQPRVWHMAPFGQNVVMTPGNSGNVYEWDWDRSVAPVIIADAPTDCDYLFVLRNIVVAFRGNLLQWTDVGSYSAWVSTTTNYAGQRPLFDSDALISHAVTSGETALLFTETRCFTMRFVDNILVVWDIKPLAEIGIIAPNARVVVNGVPYWMGQDAFYRYIGGTVRRIPCLIRDKVFKNLNRQQQRKIFCWYNVTYDEIWWHVPLSSAPAGKQDAPWAIITYGLRDNSFVPHKPGRMPHLFTAALTPTRLEEYPLLAQETRPAQGESVTNIIDETGQEFPFNGVLRTPWFSPISEQTMLHAVLPDSVQTGNITLQVASRQYVQDPDTEVLDVERTVTPITGRVDVTPLEGHFWQHTIRIQQDVDGLGAYWQAGRWKEDVTPGGKGT